MRVMEKGRRNEGKEMIGNDKECGFDKEIKA